MTDLPVTLRVQKTTVPQSKVNRLYIAEGVQPFADELACVDGNRLFAVGVDPTVPKGAVALSRATREWLGLKEGAPLEIDFVDRRYVSVLKTLRLEVALVNAGAVECDASVLRTSLQTVCRDFPFNMGQLFYLEVTEPAGTILHLAVAGLSAEDGASHGILSHETEITLCPASARLTLRNNGGRLRPGLSFEQLGIGGLKKEFEVMFRRAFVQRLFEPGLIKGFGVPHVKGIMLHGPPGTGKTLIARQLGSLLGARPPKIVNGPEILNKYVGQSEENIRNLFKEAEDEFRARKEESQLHIIIFDEIDAICKRRGSGGSAGVGDQVVNQLLSKLDGVEALDNILVIGMTNRLDLIDDALLRPGRFEIRLEIALPDESARHEIFLIHTKSMSGNNFLDSSVDLQRLSVLSKNYTGAEIAAVVRGATSFALERNVKTKEKKDLESDGRKSDLNVSDLSLAPDLNDLKVTMTDMVSALAETRPAFGVNEKEFEIFSKVFYETTATRVAFELGKSMLERLRSTNLYNTNSLLLYGDPGAGKTTLAVRIALESSFPFVKIISPRHLVGLAEYEKVNYIKDRFLDAYKSEEACVILDEIESLIEFVNIGPRFSNAILQAIKLFVKAEETRKLFVFGTTAIPDVMEECGITASFSESLEIGPCSQTDYNALVEQNPAFSRVGFEVPVVIKRLLGGLHEPDSSMK